MPTLYGTRYTGAQDTSSVGVHCTVTLFTGALGNIFYHLIFVMHSVLPLILVIFCLVKTREPLQTQFKNLSVVETTKGGALLLIKQ